jgi:two-component system sensor histidine kinase BaeS
VRARITLAFVTLIALAILLAGGGALLLVRHSQSTNAQRNIARAAAIYVNAVRAKQGGDFVKPDVAAVIKQIAGLNGETVITVDHAGVITSPPPPGIPKSAIDTAALVHDGKISGSFHHIAYAAATLFSAGTGRSVVTIALVFEATENFSSDYYFLVAGLVALIGAAILASLISRRISTRVVRVARTAERIADGDFDVRLGIGRRDYPEIAQLDRAIDRMAENLARAQQQEREFLLSISHDLRTPLTSIRGYGEAITDGAVDDPRRAAAIVVAEATRLERLIGDLLDLARLRAQQFTLDVGVVDLVTLVAAASDAFRVAFDGVGIALDLSDSDGEIPVRADPHRTSQIVANLLENALKYARSVVTVGVRTSGDDATITIADDGPGIDPDDLPHVLERLYTSNRHPARTTGTGLGLAIVAELASAMGGEVAITSPLGPSGGTEIAVTLPRDHAAPHGAPEAAPLAPPASYDDER